MSGRGGPRPGSGRPRSAPAELARAILTVAERYCAGIGGDPRGRLSRDQRWAAYLDQVGEAGRIAGLQDLPLAVQTSFAMLSKAHSARAEEAEEGALRGVSKLLAALDHRADVPSGSQSGASAAIESAPVQAADGCAPDTQSGLRSQLGLGLVLEADSAGFAGDRETRADEAQAAGGRGESPPPPLPAPTPRFEVDPQNFDFGAGGTVLDARGLSA